MFALGICLGLLFKICQTVYKKSPALFTQYEHPQILLKHFHLMCSVLCPNTFRTALVSLDFLFPSPSLAFPQ